MTQTLQNKIALVTGGSRGLGKDMALSLAKKGASVVLTYHSNQDAAAAVIAEIEQNGGQGLAFQLDTGVVSTFPAFVAQLSTGLAEKWGRDKVDFLINNAGINVHGLVTEMTEEQFDRLTNVHFKGVFFLTQKVLPMLADGGAIINLSTGLTRFCLPGYAAYASMKGAIETYTKYLAKELGPRGIRANVVAPGAIDTDFNKHALEARPQMRGFIGSQTALGRIGVAEDIGGVVAFLCSEEARWINAQRIEASGGMFL